MLTNNEILFASILGSKIVKQIPRFEMVQNELSKQVIPTIPFLPFKNQISIREEEGLKKHSNWKAIQPNVDQHFFPLKFRRVLAENPDSEPWYTFPYEPMISISGKNKIVRRSIAKAKNFIGTIKEYWSQDDYDITITGVFMGPNVIGTMQDCFPISDFQKLKEYCQSPLGIQVKCEPLRILDINYLVVESFDFPFTKGGNVQAYELKCFSDFSSDFLIDLE